MVLSVNNNDVNSPSEPSELVVTREAAPTAAPINVQVVDSNYTAIVVAWEVSILMMVHLELYLHIFCCECFVYLLLFFFSILH